MNNPFKNVSPEMQGNIIIAIGILLLLNTLGIIKTVNSIVFLIALGFIWYGMAKAGHINRIINLIRKRG